MTYFPGTMHKNIDYTFVRDGNHIVIDESKIAAAFNEFFISIGLNLASTMHSSPSQPLAAEDISIFLSPTSSDEIKIILCSSKTMLPESTT